MIFNSIEYFLFLSIVLTLYFILPTKLQNRMLLIASYFFYGWWDWRFLSLIFISTVVDYFCGIHIYNRSSKQEKKKFVTISVVVNLSILGFFKYYNFFSESLVIALTTMGLSVSFTTLNIILPVGISFYTFQTMTYSIDIYRGNTKPTNDFLDFALFVSFFPQLVAGPIERARTLLPQIINKRLFKVNQFIRGIQLIFWGMFKKVFIADNLGVIVDQIYSNPNASGSEYILATFAFAFQIYGDFSGYSDIARGTAKCLGIELMLNFKQPYISINPSDFWRRWHISLSTWLKDYLYIPLGGNRLGTWNTYRNLFLTMLLGGLWHGAAWNFVIWGAYHGTLLIVYRNIYNPKMEYPLNPFQFLTGLLNVFIMFSFICIGWIFFRAQNLEMIGLICIRIFAGPWNFYDNQDIFIKVIFFSAVPLVVMLYDYIRQFNFNRLKIDLLIKNVVSSPIVLPLKSVTYGILTYLLLLYGTNTQSFIYFQF